MFAEILATGDEIRTGALVDSNSAFIAERLEQHGVVVQRHHSVGDELAGLVTVIKEISERADLAVVTGGLGPTVDDRTTEAVAMAANVPLVLDAQALRDIEHIFEKLGRRCTPSNRKQAMIPQGATVLHNPVGTAPGFALTLGKCTFYCMPGVPPEMHTMLTEKVMPHIETSLGNDHRVNIVKTLSTFGQTESAVGEKMSRVESLYPGITLGLRAKFPEIQVKLYMRARSGSKTSNLISAATQWVREQLGAHLFSEEGDTMAATVGKLLVERKATLSVAESCTGGMVANWLTNSAGSSDYFLLSAVTYANEAKVKALGVSLETLMTCGAVHEETACQMAEGARRLVGATYGLSITGIAGPSGGSPDKPVGMVCIGLSTPDENFAHTFHFPFGQRLRNKRMFAMTALDKLRRHLLGLNPFK